MIIPSKHSGYQAGIRLYPGGGGDGPGSGGDPSTGGEARGGMGFAGTGSGLAGTGAGAAQASVGGGETGYGLGNWASSSLASLMGTDSRGNARAGTNAGQTGNFDGGDIDNSNNTVVKKTQPTGTAGTSTIDPNNPALKAMRGQPYNEVGRYYNSLLQQGYAGNDIRNALTTKGEQGQPSRPVSDSDYEILVQNAGMTSPTGRPMAGSDQFTQPVYNSAYQNYARPSTQFDTGLYGAQPMNSPAFNSGMSRRDINNSISNFNKANPNTDASNTLEFMRGSGINREDFQAYGGLNNYGPQMSMPSMQAQQSFNPYTNNQQPYNRFYGGQQQYNPFSYNEQSNSPPRSMGLPNPDSYVDSYSGRSTGLANPTNYQQQQQYNPYQQQQYNPFSYQQPQPVVPTSSGPSQAIYGRSSAMRGTPNVMRRAEGGIAGILKK